MVNGIAIETDGRVRLIILDRPNRRNAFDAAMFEAFHRALLDADRDDGVGAIVITGRGRAFSAGHDKDEFQSLWPQDRSGAIYRLLSFLPDIAKPMLAAVNGPSVGFGATLQLHCDVAIASSTASLQFPFVEIGIVPEASSSVLLERFVGPRLAADLLLTGRRLDAREAFEVGLFSRIAEEDVLQATMGLANSIVGRPTEGVHGTMKLLRASRRVAALEALEREMSLLNPLIPGLVERLARNKTKSPD